MNIESIAEVVETLYNHQMKLATDAAMRPSSMLRQGTDLLMQNDRATVDCLRKMPGATALRSVLRLENSSLLAIGIVSGYVYRSNGKSNVAAMKEWMNDWCNPEKPEHHIEGLPPEVITVAAETLDRLVHNGELSAPINIGPTVKGTLAWMVGIRLFEYDNEVSSLNVEDFFKDEESTDA